MDTLNIDTLSYFSEKSDKSYKIPETNLQSSTKSCDKSCSTLEIL